MHLAPTVWDLISTFIAALRSEVCVKRWGIFPCFLILSVPCSQCCWMGCYRHDSEQIGARTCPVVFLLSPGEAYTEASLLVPGGGWEAWGADMHQPGWPGQAWPRAEPLADIWVGQQRLAELSLAQTAVNNHERLSPSFGWYVTQQ